MPYPFQITSLEQYHKDYKRSVEDPEAFWSSVAENFQWRKKWDKVLEWNFKEPKIEWFKGGRLNITENCIDRHLATMGEKPAIIWEPNDPEERVRVVTYNRLHKRVCQVAQMLKNNGVKKGDRVCIYMGMVPELAYAVLGCARIGAIHSVIFGGFSAQSIADRLDDAKAEFIITCDGAYRGEKVIPLKSVIDDALIGNKTVKKVIVYTRTRTPVSMIKGRDVWWEDEMDRAEEMLEASPLRGGLEGAEMDAEDSLFILYTSGSTGKPKGVVHTVAGYMVWATYTFVNVFQYKPGDILFCTADIGWITGHSYIVYGPLSAGGTSLMFEGIPTYPDAGRLWDIIDKHKVNILYTAPTAIRSLMGFGLEPLRGKDLSSLKILGTVGEPINEEAWHWYNENAGKKKCPVVDSWWQTETGGALISNLAGVTPSKPSWATLPMPGVQPVLVDEQGNVVEGSDAAAESLKASPGGGGLEGAGNLCIKAPWPGIIRTTWGDHERCRQNYFATYENLYFTGDGALKDEQGNYRITGRVDDVLNVSGHRIGTAEVENAINMHAGVVESAVVGYPHDIKGQGIYAYVIYNGHHGDEELRRKDILQTVTRIIGAIAKPDKIQFVSGLPKTRSGKIMRRILRKIAEGETSNLGDTTTLLDPGVVDEIKSNRL